MLSRLENILERISFKMGQLASWLTTILVILICVDVFMRYLLNVSHVWVTELESHLFALIFLFGAAYTLSKDAHVRVDLFYANYSEPKKAVVNIVGVVLFLVPWCIVVIRASWRYAYNSFKINETSPDPGGLPALWVVKFMIVFAFILLLMEALRLFITSIQVLRKERLTIFNDSSED